MSPLPTPPPPSIPAPSAPLPASTLAPPPSLLSRTQKFVEENQRLILLGCAVLAATGAGYYFYSRPDAPGPSSPAGGESASKKKNKKKKKSSEKKDEKFVRNDGDKGPLLEEREPAQEPGHLSGIPSDSEIEHMSGAKRDELGATLKDRGNKLYAKKDYKKAIECYTKAIEISVKKVAVFYSNRAACYGNLTPPEYEKCVLDCTEAVKLDRTYTKALKRRATAYENLDRNEEAVQDFTAVSIIERFADEQAAASVERCLKKLATKRAAEILANRGDRLPSPTFIGAYLSAFRERARPAIPESASQGDHTLSLAFDALDAADYPHALTYVNEAIEQGISTKEVQAEAYNLRGTFKFLIGDSEGARVDLQKSLDLMPDFVQSWVKIASVHMELGDPAGAFGDFEAAIRHNPNDPDIYYHRGQVYFITQEFDKALSDYTKSVELDDTFIFSHIQSAVAQYKMGNVGASMAAFRRILKQFPDRGDPSNYYGEILLDQQKFEESLARFDKSIDLDKSKSPRNVLPFVNKALALFQWKQDAAGAEELCKKALEVDPECDVAVATLAQLSLQQGKITDAITWFEKSAQLARTEGELINTITYEHASKAQIHFLKNYPEYAERLNQIAQTV
ncbi:mitochondrial outer membrane 72K protein [Cryptococcus wingfieldii CBS 7118]|uniref:Mitochondrial outer membrane 72K protein n=1 Tax=Cryptococcus wingfieldii CBS 7118 TaxID=1295528 RepID=A0A1E3JG43_9TREE|nr:mitochondrial outer membrane 72K protein [Cryptococcus wingfieldii CBS 7118]ODN99615.1 mitochondrial outer membrane 72K protein [Cryptococcus wingfieldii CBS 7118]